MPLETGLSKPNAMRARVKDAFANPDAYTTSLLALLLDKYGTEALTWTPTTIQMELEEDYRVQLPQENFDRLMAGIALLTTDDFYQRLPRFIQLCNILSGDDFHPQVFNPADVSEVAWGMTEALLISPPDDGLEFAPDIRAYIGFILEQEAIANPPDILGIAIYSQGFADPLANFADDPEMYTAMSETLSSKGDEITNMIKGNLQELIAEVSSLPFEQGKPDDVVRRAQNLFRNS